MTKEEIKLYNTLLPLGIINFVISTCFYGLPILYVLFTTAIELRFWWIYLWGLGLMAMSHYYLLLHIKAYNLKDNG